MEEEPNIDTVAISAFQNNKFEIDRFEITIVKGLRVNYYSKNSQPKLNLTYNKRRIVIYDLTV